jgi:signal transduction histidine kinase
MTSEGLKKGDYQKRKYYRVDGTPMSLEEFASMRAIREQTAIFNIITGVEKEDGTLTWTSVNAVPTPVRDWRVVATTVDITKLKEAEDRILRLNRLYATFSQISQTIVHVSDQETLFQKICSEAIEYGKYRMAWIGLVESEGNWVKPFAIAGEEKDYLTDIRISTKDDPAGRGPTGRAVREGHCVICADIATDPIMTPWRERALQHGFRSSAAIPIRKRDQVIGALTAYSSEPHGFNTEDEHLLNEIGADISFALELLEVDAERKHAEQALRQTMEELKQTNTELEQFAYVASHDLQEPLRAVAGLVQLLQQQYQGKLDERADQYINLTVDSATRMQQLINDLLAFSRAGHSAKPVESVDTGRALQLALSNLSLAIQESGTIITYDNMPTLPVDTGQLGQVFQNLIGNAIKFHGEALPHIHISAKKVSDGWRFSVKDNGIGIEKQYFERIFMVFQRLHARSKYNGNGIGLAICKKIVERSGGRIWVESEIGKGTTFFFTITERR